ncbi:hypothetical protein QVD17_31860 [Tagetes erecta]|uniref:Reverse transcriptase zinc-binding domain-containing protein n=1 Tax=Tagetes erecta TaxID=13708 RepID=A0AAD8NP67_TARER|nr:hypothetical protein QVD17_31860 [Tagetes erecta]
MFSVRRESGCVVERKSDHGMFSVGSSESISFWLDKWIGTVSLKELFPDLFKLEKEKRCTVVERLGALGDQRLWNWAHQPSNGMYTAQLHHLMDILDGHSANMSGHVWRWVMDESGIFSVKSFRSIIESNRAPIDLSPFSWHYWVPLKVRCFGWRASLERIASKQSLIRRGVKILSSECSTLGNPPSGAVCLPLNASERKKPLNRSEARSDSEGWALSHSEMRLC